jgi:alanine dehydrogenase
MAAGLGAEVVVMERSIPRMRELDDLYQGRILTRYSTMLAVEEEVLKADVVIGAVLVPGASAPKLVRREHLSRMKPGSVLVDVSIDQGGCFETSHPTTHASRPTWSMASCTTASPTCRARRPRTSRRRWCTRPCPSACARRRRAESLSATATSPTACNVLKGELTHPAVAEALGKPASDPLRAWA